MEVSRGSWSNLAGQASDAVAFLKRHSDALSALRAAASVEDIRLDFPIHLRIDRETVAAQFNFLPPELVSLAGALGLGLELSIYPIAPVAMPESRL